MAPKIRKVPRHSVEPLIKPTHDVGAITYLDAGALTRSLTPPRNVNSYGRKIMLIAAVLAALFLLWLFNNAFTAPVREQEALEANLNRTVALELPSILPLMTLDDGAIVQALSDQGFTIFERIPPGTNEDGSFELIKLPPDMSIEEAAGFYLSGLDSISESSLVRLLNGSWVLNVFRNPTSIRVRYADFTSGSIDAALTAAMNAEGISPDTSNDAGVDDAGNTYRSGLVVSNGITYTWRVSVVALSAIYSTENLPSTIYYVGIRYTA